MARASWECYRQGPATALAAFMHLLYMCLELVEGPMRMDMRR